MLGIVDPKDGRLRIFRIVILDVIAVSLLSWLIVLHVAPLYLAALIGYPTLIVANFLIIWRATRRRIGLPTKDSRMPKLGWFGVAAFTISGIVMIVSWINKPDIQSATQAVIGILLAGFAWFLVYRLGRSRKDPLSK